VHFHILALVFLNSAIKICGEFAIFKKIRPVLRMFAPTGASAGILLHWICSEICIEYSDNSSLPLNAVRHARGGRYSIAG
jgi:hypothetical protein